MIDTHVHLGPPKYESVEDLDDTVQRHGLSGAVLVQHLGHTDNDYIAAARARRPDRFAAIGIPEDVASAERLMEQGFSGFRLSAQGLHHRPAESAVWGVLEQAAGVASVTGPFQELAGAEFRRLLEDHPSVTFRLEHFGWFSYAGLDDAVRHFAPILDLAAFPHVTLLWSGYFVNSGRPYPHDDAWPLMEATLDRYGPDRLMWSGDWNRPGRTPEAYDEDMGLLERLPFLGPAERAQIGSGTAARVFRLSSSTQDQEQP